jgi:hypothetical protein
MSQVKISIATSVSQFPAGTTPAGIKITLGAFLPITVNQAPYDATFDNVDVGTYVINAQAVDTVGDTLGEPIISSVTVNPPVAQPTVDPTPTPATEPAPTPVPVNVDVPSVINVTVI